jgi:DNA-nicking Smr family endonuclease
MSRTRPAKDDAARVTESGDGTVAAEPAEGGEPDPSEEAVAIPLTGDLDLHPFSPRDIPSVVEEYVRACRSAGVLHLRLAHGRGRGVQRAVVRRTLSAMAEVRSFADAPPGAGGWGATVVELRPQT